MQTVKQRLAYPLAVTAVALLLGLAVDWLFYDKALGISLLLFVLLLIGGLFGLGLLEGKKPEPRNLWLLLPLLFFSLMVAIRANAFVTVLNVLAVLALLTYLAFFYGNGRVTELGVLGAFLVPVRTGLHSSVLAVPLLAAALESHHITQRQRRLFPVLRGLLLALPLLFVFTLLLTSADLVFAQYVERLLTLDFLPNLDEVIGRTIIVSVAAWGLAGGLVYALAWRETAETDKSALENGVQTLPQQYGLGFGEAATMLALVNGLFLIFVAVQFTYLFGGERHLNLEGVTYAEYARRGFFELVVVAVLTLALVLALNWITRRSSKRQIRLFNSLSSGLALLVLVMLVSAWQRMELYETTFGYTELRLYVFAFMAWLAALLLWFLLTLWRSPHRFALGLMVAAMGYLTTLNLLNPDAFIVRQNLARYAETGDLDAAYLTTLSADAVPELVAALAQVQGDEQPVFMPGCAADRDGSAHASSETACEATLTEVLLINLRGRYEVMAEGRRPWQSAHLAHQRAYQQLQKTFVTSSGGVEAEEKALWLADFGIKPHLVLRR